MDVMPGKKWCFVKSVDNLGELSGGGYLCENLGYLCETKFPSSSSHPNHQPTITNFTFSHTSPTPHFLGKLRKKKSGKNYLLTTKNFTYQVRWQKNNPCYWILAFSGRSDAFCAGSNRKRLYGINVHHLGHLSAGKSSKLKKKFVKCFIWKWDILWEIGKLKH